jgi:predicted AAA+ superfamily ATPase
MRPMSLYESGESVGSVSLSDVVVTGGGGATGNGKCGLKGKSTLTLEDIARLIVRGGWPQAAVSAGSKSNATNAANADNAVGAIEDSLLIARDYVESIINTDASKVDNVEKNPNRVRLLMRSLARNESSEASMITIQKDMVVDGGQISTNTIAQYLNALRQLYVLEEQEAWAVAARTKVAMRSSPVRRYCDPSISCALLRMSPKKLLVDFNTFGLMFESLCIRDLRTYAEAMDASVFKYRDARGLECDAIIEAADGTWGAVEIKLQESQIEKAAKTLLRIQEQVNSQHGGKVAFMMIVTASGFAYRRDDGICIVPIGCLGP